jgi:hypothetical protein
LKQIRKRLTYANVMSSIAVFLVIGGGAAFAALGKNTVGPKQLQKNAVRTGKLAPEAVKAGKLAKNSVTTNRIRENAVTGDKIPNGAIVADKLAAGSVLTDKIADNAVTTGKLADEAVATGKIAKEAVLTDKIANGAVTGSKLGGIAVQTEIVNVANNANGEVNVDCPAGQRAIAGGGAWGNFAAGLELLSTRPIRSSADSAPMNDNEVPGGWRAAGINKSGVASTLAVWVVCIQ